MRTERANASVRLMYYRGTDNDENFDWNFFPNFINDECFGNKTKSFDKFSEAFFCFGDTKRENLQIVAQCLYTRIFYLPFWQKKILNFSTKNSKN